jgi:hypothetical protein
MTTIIVSRDSWLRCWSREYVLVGKLTGDPIKESLLEKYGIEYWHKINLDEYKLIFTDDEKMTYWILRWT